MGTSGPTTTFNEPNFSWVGLALGWGVRQFHINIRMFSKPIEFGKSQDPNNAHPRQCERKVQSNKRRARHWLCVPPLLGTKSTHRFYPGAVLPYSKAVLYAVHIFLRRKQRFFCFQVRFCPVKRNSSRLFSE